MDHSGKIGVVLLYNSWCCETEVFILGDSNNIINNFPNFAKKKKKKEENIAIFFYIL